MKSKNIKTFLTPPTKNHLVEYLIDILNLSRKSAEIIAGSNISEMIGNRTINIRDNCLEYSIFFKKKVQRKPKYSRFKGKELPKCLPKLVSSHKTINVKLSVYYFEDHIVYSIKSSNGNNIFKHGTAYSDTEFSRQLKDFGKYIKGT